MALEERGSAPQGNAQTSGLSSPVEGAGSARAGDGPDGWLGGWLLMFLVLGSVEIV